jgi:hypothetical protein
VQPYVVKQGDYLARLAYKFAFDADTVWNDLKNADLRKVRPNPNILWPTDILYIPDQGNKQPVTHHLTTGATNSFVTTDPPTGTVCFRLVGAAPSTYASKAYKVQELDQLTGLVTDKDGVATFPAPVTLRMATVVFTESGETYALSLGAIDPINTLSGVFQRLRNLGYIGGDSEFDLAADLDALRVGLLFLKASAASSSADLLPSSDSAATAASADSASSPDASASADTSPTSDSASTPPASPYTDDAGLSDDGTLSHEMQQLLLQAHGC